MKFIAIHYPEHYSAPIDILMWLYDMGEYRDSLKAQKKKPSKTDKKQTQKRDEYSDDDVDMEETTLTLKSHKDFKKATQAKKPVAPPSKPVFGAGKQLTEAQKEEERQKKLKQMKEKSQKNDVGKDKDLATLE